MPYDFLIDTYETERVKVVSVWSEFSDKDLYVGAPPLPQQETRLEFIKRYAEDSGQRVRVLREKRDLWWEEDTNFFDVRRSRAWVMTRRLTHTSHHRGQLMAMLRMLDRDLHSNYGPTADTGGLMQDKAPTIYAYIPACKRC